MARTEERKEKRSLWSVHCEPKVAFVDYKEIFQWETVTELDVLISLFKGRTKAAFDTETTGLNPDVCKCVGFSLSFDGIKGYYIPLRHREGINGDMSLLDYTVEWIRDVHHITLMFNKKFDLNIVDIAEGYGMHTYFNVWDIQALIYLRDTDVSMPSLKDASEHFLGVQQPRIGEVMGTLTFDYAAIDESTEYASLDAICTYQLAVNTLKKQKELMPVFKIDNKSIEAVRLFEREKVLISRDYLMKEEGIMLNIIGATKRKVFEMAGYEFNLNSGAQIAQALLKCGAQLTERTKPSKTHINGQLKTSTDILAKIDHPMCNLLVDYSNKFTYYNNFVRKFIVEIDKDDRLRFSYKTMSVVTGRFSSGGRARKKTDVEPPYDAAINAQNIPKPKQVLVGAIRNEAEPTGWEIVPLETLATFDENGEVVPNWDITDVQEFYVTESGTVEQNLRSAFLPEEESVFVSIDYSGQELRIAANLSTEPVWVDAFLHGRDLHMETAKAVWGVHADKNQRKKAKNINFALLYGGSDYTLHQDQNISKVEAKELFSTYNRALPTLSRWKDYMKRQARKQGVVHSCFGRPFRLGKFFKDGMTYSQQSYGERCALNYPVQGTGGDIIRIALGRILDFRHKYPKVKKAFRFVSTVHDEINFSVNIRWLHSFMKIVPRLMYMKFEGWQVPLEVDTEIGHSWGRAIVYSYDVENKLFTPHGDYFNRKVVDGKV